MMPEFPSPLRIWNHWNAFDIVTQLVVQLNLFNEKIIANLRCFKIPFSFDEVQSKELLPF